MTKPTRPSAARSLVWTMLESGGLSGLSFVTLIALSHFLSPTEFGIVSLSSCSASSFRSAFSLALLLG